MLTRDLPRLAPRTVRRARLERRLAVDGRTPVRLIVAPSGCGKTTLALQHLNTVGVGAYCAVPPDASPQALVAAICASLGLMPAANYVAMLVAMRVVAKEPLELVIDDVDHASEPARAMLTKLVENVPENISLLYCMRARDAVDAKNWLTKGLASLTDASRLAFDANDLAQLCDAYRVPYSHADISRLIDESDGWAVVVSGAVRACAEDERSLGEAYERWRARFGQVFLDFVLSEAETADPEDYARVQTLVYGRPLESESALRHLEATGLFVFNDGGRIRPFKALQFGRSVPLADVETSIPMVVRMLGRFGANIHGTDIQWVRRRDQQIVKYLLLHQGASATRAELIAAFWPGIERQLAAQSLRTACSNIRKAIASVVGYARVERYFRAGATIAIDLSNVVTDVGRFTAHAVAGDAAFEGGHVEEAAMHYAAAEKMYAGRLYDEDALEPWFAHHAQRLEDQLGRVLERLAEHAYAHADLKHAAEYAYRARLIQPDRPGLVHLLAKLDSRRHPS